MEFWSTGLLAVLRTISQIFSAGIAITAFSLLLYSLTFNLRDRVARSFALIMACVVIVFTTESIGSTSVSAWDVEFWLRMQWVGIVPLPATYFHFADALLATTGRPSRGRRRLVVRILYLASVAFLFCIPFTDFLGPVVMYSQPAPHLEPTLLSEIFLVYYTITMIVSWILFVRAYRRTTTTTSQRRMKYLIIGALAPAVGSFPFLLYSSGWAAAFPLFFWALSVIANGLVTGLMIIMSYAVAYFGVPWPDRVVKYRLFKWLMRGPFTASVTLGLVTIVRRAGEAFGSPYTGLVPVTMVGVILLLEYGITLGAPIAEKYLFDGKDQEDVNELRDLEERLLTRSDLRQFLEMVLASLCDRLQAQGAYVVSLTGEEPELIVSTGKIDEKIINKQIGELSLEIENKDRDRSPFLWQDHWYIPLVEDEEPEEEDQSQDWLGVIGVSIQSVNQPDEEQIESLSLLIRRASIALTDWRTQEQVFSSLQTLTPQMDYFQRMRAAGRYDETNLLRADLPVDEDELTLWIKDALNQFWGGPKLTESPLIQLGVVQNAAQRHEGNTANALRSVLRDAIERVRPQGEKRFTSEWILYNILEMKYIEGRKVREIASRLSISEADLYRKQRIAIEAIAKVVLEMEDQFRISRL